MAKTKTIEKLFQYLAHYSDLLPFFLFLVFFSKVTKQRSIVILAGYLLFDFIINLAIYYNWISPLYHDAAYPIFTLIETILFSWFFLSILKSPVIKKKFFLLTILVAIGYLIYYTFTYFEIKNGVLLKSIPAGLDSIPICIETILIFAFIAAYFYEQLNNNENLFIYNRPHFWGVLGIMVYLAGSFFVYISANHISIEELHKYWIITNIASITKNLLFALFFYLQVHQKTRKTSKSLHLYTTN